MHIKESLDVDTLGVFDTTQSSFGSPYSSPPTSPPLRTPHMNFQPATPTIVPPTPSPSHSNRVNGSSHSSARGQSSTSSGSDIFYDAEDSELQTKRRSMYRAPGTASSPDLATLLRKAKQRESAAAAKDANRSSRTVQQTLTPNRLRTDDVSQRSSTTNSPLTSPSSPRTPLMKGKSRVGGQAPSINGERSPDWVLASPRSMSNMKEGFKVSGYVVVFGLWFTGNLERQVLYATESHRLPQYSWRFQQRTFRK